MKKIISSILALNLLAMCIPFGYAAFTDVENSHVIDTVVGLGLMEGNSDGTFMPDSNLTRGEFAQIISEVYTYGEDDSAVAEWKQNFFEGIFDETELIPPEVMEEDEVGIFDDVFTNNDYYDAIELVATRGIMIGTGGNYFEPDGNITVEQALKVVSTMMGYGYIAETMGGYPAGFNAIATQTGLTKNVGAFTSYATREDIATILYNALDVELMQLLFVGEKGWTYDTVEDETFLTKLLNMGYTTGRMTNNGYTSLTQPLDSVENYVVINNKEYRISEEHEYARDYIGREVRLYYYLDNGENDEFVFASLTGRDEIVSFDISSFLAYENNKISYLNANDNEKNISIKQAPFLIMNGSAKSSFDDEDFLFNYGTVTVIKPSKQGQADLIILKSMVNFNIGYFDAQKNIAYSSNSLAGDELDLSNENEDMIIRVYNSLGELKDPSVLASGMTTTVSVGEKFVEIHISDKEEAKFAVSSVNKNSDNEVIISNGKEKYTVSKDYTDATGFMPVVGTVYDIKIDILGNVVDFKIISAEYTVGFLNKVIKYDDENTGEDVISLRIFDLNLKKLSTTLLASKVKITDTTDDTKNYKMPDQASVVFDMLDAYIHETINNERTRTGRLFRYKLDDDGNVTQIELAGVQENSLDDSERLVEIKIDRNTENSLLSNSEMIGGKVILHKNVNVLQCNYNSESFDTDNGYVVADRTVLKERQTGYDIKAYSLVKNSPVTTYVVYNNDPTVMITTKAPQTCGIVTNIETVLNTNDDVVTNIRLSNVDYEVADGVLAEGNVKNIQGASSYVDGNGNKHYFEVEVGDIIRYGFDAEGAINQVQLVYDANADYSDGITIGGVVYNGWSSRGNLAGCSAGFDTINYQFSNPFSVEVSGTTVKYKPNPKIWASYDDSMRVMLGSVVNAGDSFIVTTTRNMSERPGEIEDDEYTSNIYSVTTATLVNVGKKNVSVSTVPVSNLKSYLVSGRSCDRVFITSRIGKAYNCIVYRYED